jgi:LacI family transcriptional regulator
LTQRRVTVEDVARHAGVSTATVSRTVNGTARVADETLDRVRAAIDALGFRPNPAARNLRQQRTRTIALVTPSIVNPFFPELVAGVHPELRRRGYSLMLIDSEEPEADAARVAESRLVDGVLLVGSVRPTRTGTSPLTSAVPVVAFDRAPAGGGTTVVQCDNVAGAAAVVEHLVAGGHTRIAHIGGPAALDVARQRANGYRTTLAAHGLDLGDALVASGDFSEDSGYAAALELLARGEPPTAVFAANDMMAIGAIAAFQLSGMVVPTDVAVAGFDGIHLGGYVQPTLTTYAQPIAEIAARAVQLLLDEVDDDAPTAHRGPRARARTYRLEGALVVRGSTERRRR